MTSTFHKTQTHISSIHSESDNQNRQIPPQLPKKHWSQTCHETILLSNDKKQSIRLSLAGGSDNGQFIYFNETISILNSNSSFNIIKGGKIDSNEIILEIDRHKIAGCTLTDVQTLIETNSSNGKPLKLKTIKSGLTKDLREFLNDRFESHSIDHDLQHTIRNNVYMKTVPCTTRPPRSGEINGQDYTFLSVNEFCALEKSGNLLESGVYKGHYYGTPRPTKETIKTNSNSVRRNNSASEMFQTNDPEFFNNINQTPSNVSSEMIECSLKKGQNGFGFILLDGGNNDERYLQIKDILPDGPAAKDGRLRRGDILVYINDINVLGYSHTDALKIFQSLPIGDTIHLAVCRGYPLVVNFDDPQVDLISLNGIHHLPNGGYREYLPNNDSRLYTVKVRKGERGFGFTIADHINGQRVKTIFDKQRCQDLCENDLLLSVNGRDLNGKQHNDVVAILAKCPKEAETIFVVRRGDPIIDNNQYELNGNYQIEKTNQSNNRTNSTGKHVSFLTSNLENKENGDVITNSIETKFNDKIHRKTPTSFSTSALIDSNPIHSRIGTKTQTISDDIDTPYSHINEQPTSINLNEYASDIMHTFDRQTGLSRSARNIRPKNAQPARSKTPGPEFGSTTYRTDTLHVRSKTPTPYEFPSNSIQNSRSLQSIQTQYTESVINLTLSRQNEGFGLRIVGGEEEKSQVAIGHIVPNSPADVDGRLRIGDEIIKIDDHSTIRATHERTVQLMQRAKEKQNVCLLIRRYTNSYNRTNSFRQNSTQVNEINHEQSHKKSKFDNGIRYVTLQKTADNQSFGFVLISTPNKAGALVGEIVPNSPAQQSGQLHVNDRILAVNSVNITHMNHTEIVNLIRESGRLITLTIGSSIPKEERKMERHSSTENTRLQQTAPVVQVSPVTVQPENHQTLRNALSHNPLNTTEKNPIRSSMRTNGVSKSISLTDQYYIVDLQRSSIQSSFGFSIRGGREFSIPLFILKLAENGLAERDGQMKPGDQVVEINGRSTYGMTHADAISLIRDGGLYVRLLLRKTNAPPPTLEEVKAAMGNDVESLNTFWKPSSYA